MKKLIFTFLVLALQIQALTAVAPCIGEKIISPNHEYIVVSKLNKGYFSEIFEVQDEMGESHALKWYKDSKNVKKPGILSFFGDANREFIVGATLSHPSIIKVADTWESANDQYLIMELAEGKPLCKLEKDTLTCKEAIHISLQLIDAVKYAFCNQYSYTNLYGGSLVLNEALDVKIVDLAAFVSFEELKAHLKIKNPDAELTLAWLKYFNQLTETCMQIFDQVPFSRVDRIDRRVAIKKVVWDLVEDYEEKQEIHFENQYDLLIDVINSFN